MILELRTFLVLMILPLLANCSSHPEIVPYDSAQVNELDSDEGSEEAANDSVFEDAVKSEKPFDLSVDTPQSEETVAALEAPPLPPAGESKAASPRHQASAGKSGYYTFSRDCVMRAEPNAGSVGSGQVPQGKKLWLDVHNSQWLKAYKKAGTVYVPSTCVK